MHSRKNLKKISDKYKNEKKFMLERNSQDYKNATKETNAKTTGDKIYQKINNIKKSNKFKQNTRSSIAGIIVNFFVLYLFVGNEDKSLISPSSTTGFILGACALCLSLYFIWRSVVNIKIGVYKITNIILIVIHSIIALGVFELII